VHVHPDEANHPRPPHAGGRRCVVGKRWDGTTPTDTRSQRSRTSRRGGQLLTRARSPSSRNGLPPYVSPESPCSGRSHRMPTSDAAPAEQRADPRALYSNTGYQRDRIGQRSDPADGQSPRALPERADRPHVRLDGDHEPGPHRARSETLDDALETRPTPSGSPSTAASPTDASRSDHPQFHRSLDSPDHDSFESSSGTRGQRK
jgi:hypothetical protein